MRIGIDMLPVQSPGSRHRGVGRYARELVGALLPHREHEFLIYAHQGFPIDQLPPNVSPRWIDPESPSIRHAMIELADRNPDQLDVLVILNPFELCPGYDPPPKPRNGLRMAAVVYDFIPFLDQEHYLDDPGNADWFYRRLKTISRYDQLLAISDATRDDAIRLLCLDRQHVVNISGASDSQFFTPDRSHPMPWSVRKSLADLGVRRSYVLSVAGADERKNVRGLIDGFAGLPLALRMTYQLVVACHLKTEDAAKIQRYAADRGLKDELVLTGEVSDTALRTLYQRCSVFAFPSLYEGLGLPLLEAMHCGVPVLAGANSSQIEVVGDSGILVNAGDPTDISRGLSQLLNHPDQAKQLARKGMLRASSFTWARSALRTLTAIETKPTVPRRLRRDLAGSSRSRIAVVSPWRPKKSGISTYAEWLVAELAKTYRVDLYHDSGYVPDLGLRPDGFSCFDYRLFEQQSKHRAYDAVLYQMGNSTYHGFMYDLMLKYPGIVTLHDFSLAGFQYWRASQSDDPEAVFRSVIESCEGDRAPAIRNALPSWKLELGGVQEAFTRRGIHLNRSVLNAAERVILHSSGPLTGMAPELAEKVRVIPHGAWPLSISDDARAASRTSLGLGEADLLFASFGFLSRSKMNVESIRSFARILPQSPKARFLFVGHDCEGGEAADEARLLGIDDRVHFLGHRSDAEFDSLMAAVDIGVSLRRPPTYGETSGALLNMLRRGIPTIVSNVGTFADFPSDVVWKVRDDADLVEAMTTLASQIERRRELGIRAFRHVASFHAWPLVVREYIALIDEAASPRSHDREAKTQTCGVTSLGGRRTVATSVYS